MSELRNKLIENCRQALAARRAVVQKSMDGLKSDLENETKSSAGDKYETGREMINIEWNKLSIQLNEYDRQEAILDRIERKTYSGEQVALGSIVKTGNANYFISIPAGELKLENEKFYAVGIQAPVAQKLLTKKKGDKIELNGNNLMIEEII